MIDFAAIDFETANLQPSSVCSVGVVVVRQGVIVDKFYSLIKPEPDYYIYWNSRVHGLTERDTFSAPLFPDVWNQIDSLICNLPLVAHNKSFDERCLKAVFKTYQMDYPDYKFHCSLTQSRQQLKGILPNFKLDSVASFLGFDLKNHHHALADAEACAHIMLALEKYLDVD